MPIIVVPGPPIAKPRMTRRDRWLKRPCTEAYWAYKDRVRQAALGKWPEDCRHIQKLYFWLPIPKSYSKTKRESLHGFLHDQKPDLDNLLKAILDLLYEDKRIGWIGEMAKYWDDGEGPRTEIYL